MLISFGSIIQAKTAHAMVVEDIAGEASGLLNSIEDTLGTAFNAISSYADDSIWIKDYVLDPLAWAMSKGILQSITDSTVSWINSGFKGSPSFVQNPEQFFQKIGDNVAGNFIAGSGSPLAALCSPIALNVRLALALNQAGSSGSSGSGSSNPYSCTLSSIIKNVKGATINGFEAGDFSQGGWASFLALGTEPQNNLYGAYINASLDLDAKTGNQQETNQNLLNQNSGFLSFQQCTPSTATQGSDEDDSYDEGDDSSYDNSDADYSTDDNSSYEESDTGNTSSIDQGDDGTDDTSSYDESDDNSSDQNSSDNQSNTSCDSEGNCTDSNSNTTDSTVSSDNSTDQNSSDDVYEGSSYDNASSDDSSNSDCDSEGNCGYDSSTNQDNTDYSDDSSYESDDENIPDAPAGADTGEDCQTVTPGSVISSSLNKALGSGQDSLVQSSMLDEIIGALASKLVSQVLSSSGLSGVSQSSNGQPSYLSQLESEAASSSAASATLGGSLSSNLSQYITNATSIQSYASSSVAIGENALASLNSASSTCQSDRDTNVVSQVSIEIASTTAWVTQLQSDYDNITGNLNNLVSLGEQVNTATSTASIASLTQQYETMVGTYDSATPAYDQAVPSLIDIQSAKTDNSNDQGTASTITSDASNYIQQCQLYANPAGSSIF